MRRISFVLMYLCFCAVCISAQTELKIALLNGTSHTITVSDDIDEIYGVKMHLYFKKSGDVDYAFDHTSPVQKIENVENLQGIKKISLFMELNNVTDYRFLNLPNVSEIYISYGFTGEALPAFQNLEHLKVLYLSDMKIGKISGLDLSRTNLEYLELSYSGVTEISGLKLPGTLRYLNIIGNKGIVLDGRTIAELNAKNVSVFSDEKIPRLTHQFSGQERYDYLPREYINIGP